MKLFLTLFALALLAPQVSLAQSARPAATAAAPTPEELPFQGSGAWRAFTAGTGAARQCYALGTPRSSTPASIQPGTDRRGATNIFITTRPAQNVRNEVSIVIGYEFRANATATLEVRSSGGNRSFRLFTRERGAWLQNAAEEGQLIEALRRGREVRVTGTSQRGTQTVDTYALDGISAALDRVTAACPAAAPRRSGG